MIRLMEKTDTHSPDNSMPGVGRYKCGPHARARSKAIFCSDMIGRRKLSENLPFMTTHKRYALAFLVIGDRSRGLAAFLLGLRVLRRGRYVRIFC